MMLNLNRDRFLTTEVRLEEMILAQSVRRPARAGFQAVERAGCVRAGLRALAAALAAAVLAGCGGGGGSSASGGSPAVAFSVTPTELRGDAQAGQPAIRGREVRVSNSGGTAFTASVRTDSDWVSVSPATLEVPANGSAVFTVDATCTEHGTNDATVTVAAGGAERRVAVRLECAAPQVTIEVVESPTYDDGSPRDPPDGFLTFELRSSWNNPPTLNYEVEANDRIVVANPARGKARIGQPVEVALTLSRCVEPERFEFDISISVEHVANPKVVTWLVACNAGNPAVTHIETYQGPLVQRWDVEEGRARKHGGRNVDPMRGRAAAIAVLFTHDTRTLPELGAVLVQGRSASSTQPVPSGGLDKVVGERIVVHPEDFAEDPFESEVVFEVPGEFYRPGVGIEVTVDPGERLPESNESDNVTRLMFPDAMVRTRPIEVRVLAFNRRLAEGESSEGAVERGRVVPTLAPPEQFARRIEDYMPVADGVEERLRILQSIDSSLGGEFFHWEDALDEVEWNRTRFAERLSEHWIGVARRPSEGEAATCGIAFVRGRSSVVAEFSDSVCGPRAVAHELGHNFGLHHVDGLCGSTNHDFGYPYAEGVLGPNRVWFRGERRFVEGPEALPDPNAGPGDDAPYKDIMTYCTPSFTSDYSYDKALDWRVENDSPLGSDGGGPVLSAAKAARTTGAPSSPSASLALMGRIAEDGLHWTVERAALVPSAPFPPRPAGPGEHQLIVYDAAARVIDRRAVVPVRYTHGERVLWSARLPATPVSGPLLVEVRDGEGRILLQHWVDDLPVVN